MRLDEMGISPEISKEERLWSTFCHLSCFAIFLLPPVGHLIAPLILWLIKRHDSAFIDEHGKEAINFQISVSLYAIPCVILTFFLIGIPLAIGLALFWFGASVYAAIQANDGMVFRYPLTIRFL